MDARVPTAAPAESGPRGQQATAPGFGSALTSGKAMGSRRLRELFALAPEEQSPCFISIGTVASQRKPRPPVERYLSRLEPPKP